MQLEKVSHLCVGVCLCVWVRVGFCVGVCVWVRTCVCVCDFVKELSFKWLFCLCIFSHFTQNVLCLTNVRRVIIAV